LGIDRLSGLSLASSPERLLAWFTMGREYAAGDFAAMIGAILTDTP
jgi:hypothetical protein